MNSLIRYGVLPAIIVIVIERFVYLLPNGLVICLLVCAVILIFAGMFQSRKKI